MHASSAGKRFIGAFIAVLFLAPPIATLAATASPQAVLDAIQAARDAGFCRETTEQVADCSKTTVRCDGGTGRGWAEYVDDYFELVGGSVQAKQRTAIETTVDPLTRELTQTTVRSTEVVPIDALDYLRADWQRNRTTPPGPIQKGTCYCACEANDSFAACAGQPEGFPFQVGQDLTYEQCVAQCSPRQVAVDKCAIAPIAPSLVGTAASTAGFQPDAWCFTAAECADQRGFFEAYAQCGTRGRCYAAEPPISLQIPIGDVTEVQGLSRYVLAAYRYGISITAIAATVMFVYGAFLYLVGSALPSIDQGKRIMREAMLGMIFVFAATMILRTINPATTTLDPLKVYMVNTRQFVTTTQCVDLGRNVKVAFAGIRPDLASYESVAARGDAFQLSATETNCGESYWIQGVENRSCDGSKCPSGELCISCSDPNTPGCGGVANDRRTCVRLVFGGTIDYIDGRFPTRLELVGVCRDVANASDAETIEGSIATLHYTFLEPERVGRRLTDQATDPNRIGRVSYRLDFDEEDISSLESSCADRGGFAGAVLAVVYASNVFGIDSLDYDDLAILSPVTCGPVTFNGYANGTAEFIGNEEDIASGLFCGVGNGKFTNASGQFWTEDTLRAAARGDGPIPCNFSLTAGNAPNDPADSFCREGFRGELVPCEDGIGCFEAGTTCRSATQTCECVEEGRGAFGLSSTEVFRNCQPL